ncbi:hypothetical protein DL765_008236 [Monosporascus sp. GIB2]|nr:hypothetical protein DL765_008236 [Monosporascus sp. GIB2]
MRLHGLLFCLCIHPSYATVTPSVQGAKEICLQLELMMGNVVFTKDEADYESLRTKNWVQTAWGVPACIFHPLGVEELQEVVPMLVGSNASFAVRSGGHSPHRGFASIDGGVLIDMSNFNLMDYNPDNNVVVVGAGVTWGDLYTHLQEHQVIAVGGRIMDVGVGGLTLGGKLTTSVPQQSLTPSTGGLSWLSDLYGLACDNAVNFRVVLADGSLVDANSEANSDLFWALKGGGNNFGILIEVTLMTYPLAQVWGGIKTYAIEQVPEVMAAYFEYQSAPIKDPHANLIILISPTNSTIGVWLSMVYLKPEEKPAVFAPFYAINTISDSTAIKSFTDFDWFTTSLAVKQSLYDKIGEIITTSESVDVVKSSAAGFMGITLQPISARVVEIGRLRGGNALGLQALDQTWLATALSWWWPEDDRTIHAAGHDILDELVTASKAEQSHLPYLFMNDASWDQQVIASYGEDSLLKLREVQNKYDPDLVFQRLMPGGFKLPARL